MTKYKAGEIWGWDNRDPFPPIASQPNPCKLKENLGDGKWSVYSHQGAKGSHSPDFKEQEWVECDYIMLEGFLDYYREQK